MNFNDDNDFIVDEEVEEYEDDAAEFSESSADGCITVSDNGNGGVTPAAAEEEGDESYEGLDDVEEEEDYEEGEEIEGGDASNVSPGSDTRDVDDDAPHTGEDNVLGMMQPTEGTHKPFAEELTAPVALHPIAGRKSAFCAPVQTAPTFVSASYPLLSSSSAFGNAVNHWSASTKAAPPVASAFGVVPAAAPPPRSPQAIVHPQQPKASAPTAAPLPNPVAGVSLMGTTHSGGTIPRFLDLRAPRNNASRRSRSDAKEEQERVRLLARFELAVPTSRYDQSLQTILFNSR